jgi:hypothetical protein
VKFGSFSLATVFVTGSSGGTGSDSDYATIAYKAGNGGQLWVQRYNGPGNAADFPQALVLSPDRRRAFVTGYSYSANSFSDYATIAYDAVTGLRIWLRRYDDPINGFDFAYALTLSPDATKLFVTGSCDEIDTGTDFVTLAYDAAMGERLWLRRYNGPANNSDSPAALGVSPDGEQVFVTGRSSGVASPDFPFDYATIAYRTSNGHSLWLDRHKGSGNRSDVPADLAVSPDGSRVFVTGSSDGITSGTDYLTLAYSFSPPYGVQIGPCFWWRPNPSKLSTKLLPGTQPQRPELQREPENCFNAFALFLPGIGGSLSFDKIDAMGIDLWRKGGATLSRRYLRRVISTISARVKRSSTVLIALRTSNINIRRPQCTSSGQEQRAYDVALTHRIGASGPSISRMTAPNFIRLMGRASE